MNRPRVLIVHPRIRHMGGGNLLCAWTIEALRRDYEVSVATLVPPDYEAVNLSFGPR